MLYIVDKSLTSLNILLCEKSYAIINDNSMIIDMRYLKEKLWKPQPAPRYSLCIILSSQIDGCNDGMSVIGFFDWDPNSKVSSLTRFTSIPRPQHQMPQMRLDARSCRFWHLDVNIIREKHIKRSSWRELTRQMFARIQTGWYEMTLQSAVFYRTSNVSRNFIAPHLLQNIIAQTAY